MGGVSPPRKTSSRERNSRSRLFCVPPIVGPALVAGPRHFLCPPPIAAASSCVRFRPIPWGDRLAAPFRHLSVRGARPSRVRAAASSPPPFGKPPAGRRRRARGTRAFPRPFDQRGSVTRPRKRHTPLSRSWMAKRKGRSTFTTNGCVWDRAPLFFTLSIDAAAASVPVSSSTRKTLW